MGRCPACHPWDMARRRQARGSATGARWLWGTRGPRLFGPVGVEYEPSRDGLRRADVVRLVKSGEMPVATHDCGEGVVCFCPQTRRRPHGPQSRRTSRTLGVGGRRPVRRAHCPTWPSCAERCAGPARHSSFVTTRSSDPLIAATSSIDARSGLGQGSVQVSGVVARIAAVHVRRVTLIWRALPRTPLGRERLKKGMLCS